MKLKYRKEIDGLRAIAVVPVILFHVGFEAFSGGYSGVDVFFVISGYLITSIIWSEFLQRKFSFLTFYERRARRILPLLFFILAISLPCAWISLYQTDMIDYFESLIAVPLFSANLLFTSEANYFDTNVELKPLLHTWSLAVEEQFYIFFPILVMLLFRIRKKSIIPPLIISSCILSFLLSEWASTIYPTHNFYLLPSRVWELGLGAMLAVLATDKDSLLLKLKSNICISEILGLLGLGLILAGIFVIKGDSPYPSAYTLFPVIGTGLIIAFASEDSAVGKILSAKPLVMIGLISYSAYLWHHVIFAYARHLGIYEDNLVTKLQLSLVIFPLSYVSWKFVENPFRNKEKFSRSFIFLFSVIGSVLIICLGIVGIMSDGFPSRQINRKLEIHSYNPDNRQLQQESWTYLRQSQEKHEDMGWFYEGNSKPNLLLLGNSHSKDMFNVLRNSASARANFNIGIEECQISEFSNLSHAIFQSENYMKADVVMIASKYHIDDISYLEVLVKRLIDDSKRVVIVKEVHNFRVYDGKTYADLVIQKHAREGNNFDDLKLLDDIVLEINKAYFNDYSTNTTEREEKADRTIDAIEAKYRDVIILDRMEYICDKENKVCHSINVGLEKFFYDYGHHTIAGAAFFGSRVDTLNWLSPLVSD